MELTIVIVNWNSGDCLLRMLESVHNAVGKSWSAEIVVVDNASTDASVERVKERFRGVRVLQCERNIGFGAANNLAFRQAQGRFVLILNPDTIVDRRALQAMLEFMASHRAAGACGPKLLGADGRTLSPWCARRELFPIDVFFEYTYLYRLFPHHRVFARYTMGDWDHTADRQVVSVSGACMLLRRAALEQVGGFDERFFMYGEDVDLCRRLRLHGWQVWFVAGAAVRHLGAQSTRRTRDRGALWAVQSMTLLFRKYGRPIDLHKVKLALSLGCLVRSIAWLCAGLIMPRHLRDAWGRSAGYFSYSFKTWLY
jgi:GT2 family glycosyltransferase